MSNIGEKVTFVGATQDQINWGGCDDPRSVLAVGALCYIEAVEEHSWHTKIRLAEVEGWFNNASFEKVI